jgi:beta-glucosidase
MEEDLLPGSRSRIEDLLAGMTIEEKVGQLNLLTGDLAETGPPQVRADHVERIRRGQLGGLFNVFGRDLTRELQRVAVEETRLGIPLLFGFDVIHGHRTIFPIPLGEAASWDMAVAERTARIAAIEAAADGLHWTFAPMLDVCRDPRWGRIAEGPGESVLLANRLAVAKVRGFQGDDLGDRDSIAATAKHIGAYGAPVAGRDYNTADISERTLREIYLPPFAAAVAAGVASVMPAFNDLAGVPATANEGLLTGVLRKEWGFDGVIVSDFTAIAELVMHGVAGDLRDAAVQAVRAGVDLDMQSEGFVSALAAAVEEGAVPVTMVDAAVRRVLVLKARLGLFDYPYRRCAAARPDSGLRKEHRQTAREAARRSIVLLKNRAGMLPVRRDVSLLAVIGPLADARAEMLGPWAGAGDPTEAVTILDGIRTAVAASTRVVHCAGCSTIAGDDRSLFAEAVAMASLADAVVLCLGEAAGMSGEAASRTDIDLPGVQRALAEAVLATGRPTVVTLSNGRPLALPWLAERAKAILETWFLGTEAGNAVADVLFGDFNPSGRLPVTIPRSIGQVPIHHDGRPTGRPPSEERFTSKYLDAPTTPLFPFGFGLSYTTFHHGAPVLSASVLAQDGQLSVTTQITNTGSRAGEELVQMYVRDVVASVARPVLELKDFARIALRPGESGTVTFTLTAAELGFYRRDMSFGVEPGEVEVLVGPHAAELQAARFILLA